MVGRRSWLASSLLASCLALLGALPGCDADEPSTLRAFVAQDRQDLVGGPVSYADIGDFILENDKIRVAILGPNRSWGPGVFGGSLVDADVRRNDPRFPPGQGRDKLAEVFPFANLLVPAPLDSDVRVLADGSDGKAATVRVEGKGVFLFEALSILESMRPLLGLFFPDVKTAVNFRTDYTLHPGESFVTMKTWVILRPRANQGLDSTAGSSCQNDTECGGTANMVCKGASASDKGKCTCKTLSEQGCAGQTCTTAVKFDSYGCTVCGCSDIASMQNTMGSQDIFKSILGQKKDDDAPYQKAGVGGGDFVFFGNQTDIFVPGHGFDEEKPVWDALFGGRDTFGKPLAFDFVSASGGEVSYAYYTKRQAAAGNEPQVLVPVFTSAATAFVTAALGCSSGPEDDKSCDDVKVMEYERYLAVGHGDVGSVSDIVYKHRGTATGTLKGAVVWSQTGQPAPNATVFVLRDPDPKKQWVSLDQVLAANRAIDASPGVLNAIEADPGAELKEDGSFQGTLPPGDYLLVAMDAHKVVASAPIRARIDAGKTQVAVPALPSPGRVRIDAIGDHGGALPAKLTVVRLDANGEATFRDGGRMPFFGQGRLGVGVERLQFATDGRFDIPLAAGRYRVVVSHGTEWSIHDQTIDLKAGDTQDIRASLTHEIDTTGWISGDFHLHAEPSFDSGMPLGERVKTVAAEGVDYVAATDHDVLSDYLPWVKLFGLQNWLLTVVGAEVSTLEIGHYIGFPLKYSQSKIPHHGSVDWYCRPSTGILQDILARTGLTGGAKPTTIIAHPRDGFLGWLDQAGVNGYSLTRTLSAQEENNSVLRTVACDQDAMEVFNGKRFDSVHTATVWEVQVFSRCLDRIDRAGVVGNQVDDAKARAEMQTSCPELAEVNLQNPLQLEGKTECPAGEDLADCRMRYRMALAAYMAGRINQRTPEEQDAWLNAAPTKVQGEKDPQVKADKALDAMAKKCTYDPDLLAQPLDQAVPQADWNVPCGQRDGVLSDYFRFLEHGYVRALVGGSDSHGYKQEPGLPRTYVKSATDAPSKLDTAQIAANLRGSQTVPSYGPFIQVGVAGKGPGELAKIAAGQPLAVKVKVQTASWFGVDRVEIYLNGALAWSKQLPVDAKRVIDLDETVNLTMPNRDSHLVVVAVGADPKSWMRPVYLDVPFGELQLARVASIAFSALFAGDPALASLAKSSFPPPAKIPDFFPVYPMAISSAVLLDADGNGKYDAPLPAPAFCSPQCDVKTGEILESAWDWQGKKRTCKELQSDYECLATEGRCGLPVPGICDIYSETQKGALRDALGTHRTP
jgi:hypothetical protein